MPVNRLVEFAPISCLKSFTIVRASATLRRVGGRILHVLLAHGCSGHLYLANLQKTEIQDRKACVSACDIPRPSDAGGILEKLGVTVLPAGTSRTEVFSPESTRHHVWK